MPPRKLKICNSRIQNALIQFQNTNYKSMVYKVPDTFSVIIKTKHLELTTF
jgi:hypothetical protein